MSGGSEFENKGTVGLGTEISGFGKRGTLGMGIWDPLIKRFKNILQKICKLSISSTNLTRVKN